MASLLFAERQVFYAQAGNGLSTFERAERHSLIHSLCTNKTPDSYTVVVSKRFSIHSAVHRLSTGIGVSRGICPQSCQQADLRKYVRPLDDCNSPEMGEAARCLTTSTASSRPAGTHHRRNCA